MKLRFPLSPAVILQASIAIWFTSQPVTQAATLTWDAGNTANGSTIDPADGTWDLNALNTVWNNAGTNVVWSQTSATSSTNDAVFGESDGTYAINVGAGIAVGRMYFNNSGYTLSASGPQTVTVTNSNTVTPGIVIASGKTATIGNNVTVTAASGTVYVGNAAATAGGTLNIDNGGTLTRAGGNSLNIEGTGTIVNVKTGGILSKTGTSGTIGVGALVGSSATLNVQGGTVSLAGTPSTGNGLIVGGSGQGTVTLTNGAITIGSTYDGGVTFAAGGTDVGATVFNLDGGTLTTPLIKKGTGTGRTATFNFNGGTLTANKTNTAFMEGLDFAYVTSGGAKINTVSTSITIAQDLLTDAVSTGGGLTKTGTGSLTLSGINTFTGAIVFDTTTTSAGTLAYATADGANAITFNQTTSTATLSYVGSADKTMSGAITASALTSGTITLDSSGGGAVNYSNTGSLGNSAASGVKTLVLSGTNAGNNTFAGNWEDNTLGGASKLTKSGNGKWILTNANTFTGATTIQGGTLVLADTSNLANTSGVTFNTSNGSLVIGTDTAFTTLPPISSGSGAFTYTIVSDRATAGAALNHALGAPFLGSSTLAFTSGANVTSGTAGVTFSSAALTSGTSGTAILSPTTANLTITGGVTSQANNVSRTLQLDGTSSGNSIGGAITQIESNPGLSLLKSNTSTWTLTGANAYTGTTIVSGGKLFVNGDQSLATGDVNVSALATLGGTGTIGGNTTIADTGKLEFNLSTAPGSHDKLELASGKTLTFSGGSTLTLTSGGGATTGLYTLVTAPGALSITGSVPAVDLPVGWTAAPPQIVADGPDTSLQINITSVGGGSGFDTWKSNNPGSTGQTLADDHDNDGVDNGVEYFLVGPNVNSTGFNQLPPVVNNAGLLSVTWPKAPSYTGTYTTDYVVETSENLTGWTGAATNASPNVVDTVYIDTVNNTITYTFPAGTKKFARLKVTGP